MRAGELPPARCLRAPCAGRGGSLAILLPRSRLIASGFVNAKITSSLALAGGVEQQTYSIFKKAALQSWEGWGNRLPVSVSLPAETISAGTARCETLSWPQKPDRCTGSLENTQFSLFYPGTAATRSANPVVFWSAPLCRCPLEGRSGFGCQHPLAPRCPDVGQGGLAPRGSRSPSLGAAAAFQALAVELRIPLLSAV